MNLEQMGYHEQNLVWTALTVIFIIVTSTIVGLIAQFTLRLTGASEQEQRRAFWGFTFAGPWIVGFLIFVLGPAVASFYYSFTDYKVGQPMKWIDIDNYRTLLLGQGAHGRRFKQALFNSFYYTIIGVPLQILAALSMALLLNRESFGIRWFRTVYYLPVILAGSPAALLAWRYMLNPNGGFINVALRRFAESFFVFDYLYRNALYLFEGFNGFYIGITRGNPVGPFKYTLPSVIAILILLALLGEWTQGKRTFAIRSAELLSIAVAYNMMSIGLVSTPVDLSWTYFAGLVLLAGVTVNALQGRRLLVKSWQFGGLGLLLLTIWMTLRRSDYAFNNPDTQKYLIALTVTAVPLLVSLVGEWNRRKTQIIAALGGVLVLIIFVRIIPGQLDGNGLRPIWSYLTFGSTIQDPQNQNYLEKIHPREYLSTHWIYGLVIISLLGIALLNHYPRSRQYLLGGTLLFFSVFALGSFLDGRTYFQAFDEIAKAANRPTYHFALFRQVTDTFPDKNRVPLWMNNELWSKPSLVLITMWSSGAGMLIFLAALKGVPKSLYEAAEVDGANAIQKFFKITLPMISPAMFYNVVIGMIAALQTFESVYILRTTQNEDSLASAAFFLFVRTFRQLWIGQGAAASWILTIIIVTLTILQFRYSQWVNYEV